MNEEAASEAVDMLGRIQAAQAIVTKWEDKEAEKKGELKIVKEEIEGAREKLAKLIRESKKEYPLFAPPTPEQARIEINKVKAVKAAIEAGTAPAIRLNPIVEESTPDGGAVVTALPEHDNTESAWRSKPLRELGSPTTQFPTGDEADHFEMAVLRLDRRSRSNGGPIVRLGELIDELNDTRCELDDLTVTPDGLGNDTLEPAEVKALQFALLSYRERDESFARDVPVGLIDPTAEIRYFKVVFKGKAGKALPDVYLKSHSHVAAVDHAEYCWPGRAGSVTPIDGEPPEGAKVEAVPLESYEDRRAGRDLEKVAGAREKARKQGKAVKA